MRNMNMQEYLDKAIKEARDGRFAENDQLTLGQLIKKFEPIAEAQRQREKEDREEATVGYDFEYLYPTGIDSWRGNYSELALNFTSYSYDKDKSDPMKVSEFLKMLKETVGKEFEGYKGGDYIMDEATPVWVANYGHSGNTAVLDVVDDGYKVIIITGYREF